MVVKRRQREQFQSIYLDGLVYLPRRLPRCNHPHNRLLPRHHHQRLPSRPPKTSMALVLAQLLRPDESCEGPDWTPLL